MRKLWILLVLVVAVAAVVFLAARNLNRYLHDNRAWLAEQASSALGRPLTFDAIDVSLRGGLGARVTGLSIGDDPAFSAQPFLQVADADVVLKIFPALVGRYEVRRIVLDAPRINLIRTASGFNFESLGRKGGAAAGAAPRDAGNETANPLPLLVSLLRIDGGHVRFVDRSASPSAEIEVDRLDFSASDLGFTQPISVELSAALMGAAQPNLQLSGSIGPLKSASAAQHAPVDVEAKVGPLVIDRLKQAPLVGAQIPAALSSPDPIAVTVGLTGTVDDLRATLSLDAKGAGISYGDQFAKAKGTPLGLDADLVRRPDAVDVSRFDLRVAAARLNGRGTIGLGKELPVDLQLTGKGIPLDGWEKLFPAAAAVKATGSLDLQLAAKGKVAGGGVPAVNGTIALSQAGFARPDGSLRVDGLDTTIALQGDRVEIPTTRFQVNGSPVEASATVKSLRDLAMEFSLKSPVIALAAVGASGAGVKQAEKVEGVEVRGEFRAANDGPHLDLNVRSTAGSVRDVAYQNLASEVALRGDKVTLRKLSVSTFGGNVVGAGSYDMARGQAPEFAFRGKVGDLDVAALVGRFAPSGRVQMSGKLDADLDVRGRGAEWEAIRDALTGGGSVEVKEGVLSGVNVADEVFRSITGAQGLSGLVSPALRKKYPRIFTDKDTRFHTMESRMSLGNGAAEVERLAVAADDYRLDGKGTIGLDNSLNLSLRFAASAQLTRDLLGSVKQLKYVTNNTGQFEVPVVVRGSIPSVRVEPDLAYLSERLTGALVGSGIEKGLDAVLGKKKAAPTNKNGDASPSSEGKPAKDLLRKGLEGLFGGGKKQD